MPVFGAHMSIAGGLYKSVEAAVALEMGTVQLFTHSPSQWAVKAAHPGSPDWVCKLLEEVEIQGFRKALAQSGLKFATAHDSYLINLAAPGEELYQKSIHAFVAEIERAEALGLDYLVTHPGAHTGTGEEAGIARIAAALNEAHHRCAGYRVKVLLETTAGQGTTIGHRFEHLATIRDRVLQPERLGICLDTCHVFAAGFDLTTADGFDSCFQQFDDLLGLELLKVFHINDSLKPLGSRVDRHAGLGLGCIGLEPFRKLVNDPRFADRPMILETPKEGLNDEPMDPVNLAILRGFVEHAIPRSEKSRKKRTVERPANAGPIV